MTESIAAAATRDDAHVHVGIPCGKTLCGLTISHRPRQSAIIDRSASVKLADRRSLLSFSTEPDTPKI